MKKNFCLSIVLLALFGTAAPAAFAAQSVPSSYSTMQTKKITGKVVDSQGEPIIGASVAVKGTGTGSVTNIDGKFTVEAAVGSTLEISFIGYKTATVKVTSANTYQAELKDDSQALDEVVVTAMGIKKERKALGYSMEDVKSEELMRVKTANPLSSLSGKVAGVNITQSSGAAGSGAQIILRGATSGSEGKDNQPLFVVDGVIYDNSSTVGGNSAFDGSMRSATTTSNRVMDINPEDIESMSVLKGPAAAALYGSRAANGVILITTKKGKEGVVEVNINSKLTTSWATNLPKTQNQFARGYMEDQYDADKNYLGAVFNDFAYNTWGEKTNAKTYDNIGDFFQTGTIFDENVSVAGGTKNSKFYLSGSYYDQGGIVPETGYNKYTFRFNGEQKVGLFTFNANVAYSSAHTDRTLTGAGLYGSSGNGALYGVYTWSPFDDMKHYLNEDGSRYRLFGDRLDPWDEKDNPYWIVNKNHLFDDTDRFTGSLSVKADITKWWFIQYKVGIDKYTQTSSNRLAPNGVLKKVWQNGMMSDNTTRFQYLSHDFMTNLTKRFGDFDLNLLLGTTIDETKTDRVSMMAYNFSVPNFLSYANATNDNKQFTHGASKRRLVGTFGEFRASWKDMIYLTVSGRNDWTSTLPVENRSYFYPSVSGSLVFTEALKKLGWMSDDSVLNFGKIRASWAKVGKDTGAYETATALWPVGTFLGDKIGVGNNWQRGNPYLKPEMTKSTEIGIELSFFKNRLHIDYAYYTNDSYNQILSPRGPQSTGYIFCSINAGNVLNKGMELSISGTPIETKDLRWDVALNMAGNRGRLEGLPEGMDIMYVTDVQYAGAKAASFSGGNFMGISGGKWQRNDNGELILDKNGMPTYVTDVAVGNREPKFTGGLNNTLTWKNLTFNMLWEFRVGGDVINGTKYAMDIAGVSEESGKWRNEPLTIKGVDADGNPVSHTWEAGKAYEYSGAMTSGYNIIKDFYTGYYTKETSNYLTKVNSLRLRSVSVSYELPKKWLREKIGFVKRASVSVAATNLLLFTNYDGDPEAAAAGAGVGGSSSVGFDYCGVPATSTMSFGLNLTF